MPIHFCASEADKEQQYQCTDRGADDCRENAGADMDAELSKQPVTDKRADDTDQKIADDPEASAPGDLPRQPSGNQADNNDDENAFISHVHCFLPCTPTVAPLGFGKEVASTG